MEIIEIILVVFALLGVIDCITGKHFKIGEEFEKGLHAIGSLIFCMAGFIILSPAIADLLVPVLIFAKSTDAISVIENYYSMNVSVQFDNVNFQSVKIEEGDPYRLILSSECLKNHELIMQDIFPILHSLKRHTDAEKVEIIVSDVIVAEINLNDLVLNEIHLSD